MCTHPIRIAVCGGGLGGLAFAVASSKFPHLSVHIYEASSSFSSFGAGIGIWPRAWDVLSRLGLSDALPSSVGHRTDDDLSPNSTIYEMISLRKSDEIEGYEFLRMSRQGRVHMMHRGDLQHALVRILPESVGIYHSRRLQSYTRLPSGEIRLVFQDGSQANCDVLIGADGLKSSVRKVFMQDEARLAQDQKTAHAILASSEPTWTGSVAFRELVPLARLQKDEETRRLVIPRCPTQYVGKNVNLMVYPISREEEAVGDGLINMVLFHTQPELEDTSYEGPWSAQIDGMTDPFPFACFDEWEPEARAWIKCMNNPTKWAIHAVKPLHTFVNDRVALIGDAAHAMDPHQGAGAGQAIEDAYVLAELLGCVHSTEDISHSLMVYDSLRRPFAQRVARYSRDNAHFFSLDWEGLDGVMSPADVKKKLGDLGRIVTERWDWAWRTNVAESVEDGRRRLQMLTSQGNHPQSKM